MRVGALLIGTAALTVACVQPANTQLLTMSDLPEFEGGQTSADCELPVEQRGEVPAEYRCVVIEKDRASQLIDAHLNQLRARGWTTGGAAGSAIWILIPAGQDCAQVYGMVANDYPRGSETPEALGVVLDLFLEQRTRCGDERNLL